MHVAYSGSLGLRLRLSTFYYKPFYSVFLKPWASILKLNFNKSLSLFPLLFHEHRTMTTLSLYTHFLPSRTPSSLRPSFAPNANRLILSKSRILCSSSKDENISRFFHRSLDFVCFVTISENESLNWFLFPATFALLRGQRQFRILFRCSCWKLKTT